MGHVCFLFGELVQNYLKTSFGNTLRWFNCGGIFLCLDHHVSRWHIGYHLPQRDFTISQQHDCSALTEKMFKSHLKHHCRISWRENLTIHVHSNGFRWENITHIGKIGECSAYDSLTFIQEATKIQCFRPSATQRDVGVFVWPFISYVIVIHDTFWIATWVAQGYGSFTKWMLPSMAGRGPCWEYRIISGFYNECPP